MKYFFISLIASIILFAQEKLVIDAKKFEANDAKGISIFTGDVKLRKAKDKLNADKLEVYMSSKNSEKRVPLKYIATGNVSFYIISKNKEYEGKGNRVIYYPNKEEYEIIGNGFIKEKVEDRKIYGDKIFINQITGEARVIGTDDKPVRFIINLDNNKDNSKANK